MANRYIPFGYEITDGEISIIGRESEVVKNIYALYIQGMSYLDITNRLNLLPISYASDGRKWDKNIVKRILENPKYRGEKGYPPIITEETANTVNECRMKKFTPQSEADKSRGDEYRNKTVCGICGKNMVRLHAGSGKKKRLYWKCSNTDCDGHKRNFNEKMLNMLVADALNEIASDLTRIEFNPESGYEKDITVIQAHNEMIAVMENPQSDAQTMLEKIMNLASAKFNLCEVGDNTAITDKIKEIMAVYSKQEMPDGKIIGKVVRKIKMYPDKEIEIELINGKKIRKNNNPEEINEERMIL